MKGRIPTDTQTYRLVPEVFLIVSGHVKMPEGHSFYVYVNPTIAERGFKKFDIEECSKNC